MLRKLIAIVVSLCVMAFPVEAQRSIFFSQNVTASSGSGPTLIQSCTNQGGSTAANVTCTFGSAVTAGDLIYCHMDNYDGAGPATISWVITGDTNSFTADIQNLQYFDGSFHFNLAGFYLGTAAGGETVLTATATGLQFPTIGCDEWRNIHTLDQSDAGAVSVITGTTATSNSITPTVNGALIYSMFAFQSGTLVPGTGYTASVTTAWPSMGQYQIQTTAAPIIATGTVIGGGTAWAIHIVSFKP